jgi:hypothetical protein
MLRRQLEALGVAVTPVEGGGVAGFREEDDGLVGIRGLHGWEATQAAARLSGWEGGDREGGEEEAGRPRAEGGQAPTGLGRGGLDRLGRVGEGNRKRCLWSLAAELDEFKRFKRILNPNKGLNFLINKNLNFGSRTQIKQFWNPNQALLGFQTKGFGSRRIEFNSGFWIQRMVRIFSKNENLIRNVLKYVLEIGNWLRLRNEIWTKGFWL